MSVMQYGIYLAYAPGVDLRHEGLGRYLASFLKGAAARDDVCFVLLCPSWSREGLLALFDSEGVPRERFRIVAPKGQPWLLRLYLGWQGWRRPRPRRHSRLLTMLRNLAARLLHGLEARLVRAHDVRGLLALLLAGGGVLLLLLLLSPWLLLALFLALLLRVRRGLLSGRGRPLRRVWQRLAGALGNPKDDSLVLRLYRGMADAEAERMQALSETLPMVRAWYCPTAFWHRFHQLSAPRLLCVPDVVLSEFPVGFAAVGGERFFANFTAVESSIRAGSAFVTYSNTVKWDTLVARYGVAADAVTVIGHAPHNLQPWIAVSGVPDAAAASLHYCRQLLRQALARGGDYSAGFANGELKFLFYASQFRPNKNLLTLLRAYAALRKNHGLTHKLLLTGKRDVLPEVALFIEQHHLQREVLCLDGLSSRELAACYRLAELAVNPSLSEGGCPFTFSEALSVGTPVVMARIAVTQEVLTDAELQQHSLFDPYDWQDLAARLQWALANRDTLLQLQLRSYQQLVQRRWADVVDEHVTVLERLASAAGGQS